MLAVRRFGASDERLAELWNFRVSVLFSDAEKAAFEFALAASSVPSAVDELLATQLHRHWSEDEIVEILCVIALFGFLNRWNDSMSTTLEAPAVDSRHVALWSARLARRNARGIVPEARREVTLTTERRMRRLMR